MLDWHLVLLLAVHPFLALTVRFWFWGRAPGALGETGHSTVVLVGPISSTKASTDPLHPNSMASQGSPSPTAPAGWHPWGRGLQRGHTGKCDKRNKRKQGRRREDAHKGTQEGTEKQVQKDACERGHCCGKGWEQLLDEGMVC